MEKNSRKDKLRNKCRKNIIGLITQKLKLQTRENKKREKKSEKKKRKKKEEETKEEKKKKETTELQKPNVDSEVHNNYKICDWGSGKLKSLI